MVIQIQTVRRFAPLSPVTNPRFLSLTTENTIMSSAAHHERVGKFNLPHAWIQWHSTIYTDLYPPFCPAYENALFLIDKKGNNQQDECKITNSPVNGIDWERILAFHRAGRTKILRIVSSAFILSQHFPEADFVFVLQPMFCILCIAATLSR